MTGPGHDGLGCANVDGSRLHPAGPTPDEGDAVTAESPGGTAEGDRGGPVRELLAGALYLCLVLLGAVAATPAATFPDDRQAVRLIAGTSLGLVLAHWLAFRLARRARGRAESDVPPSPSQPGRGLAGVGALRGRAADMSEELP